MLISQYTIDKLLQSLDLYEIVSHQLKLKKVGATYRGLCPFHNESTPSFTVNPQQQTYHCYGCGAHGNAITFYLEYHCLTFPEAIEELANRVSITIEYEGDGQQAAQTNFKDLHQLMLKTTTLYQQQLQQTPQALNYFQQRGLSPEIIKRYQLGYAPDSWDFILKAVGNSSLLNAVGLINQKEDTTNHYDRFRHRVIFPIHDQRGRVIAYGGRVLDDSKPKYLNSPETALFQKSQELYGWHLVRQQKQLQQVVIVEGYTDVLALAQHGINNAVATLGTSISSEHLKRIFRIVPEIIFCFDGDDAGRKAANRALLATLPLLLDGYQVKFTFLPNASDPDSYLKDYGRAGFDKLLSKSMLLSTFLFNQYLQHDTNQTLTPEAIALLKVRADKDLIPLINQMPSTQFKQSLLSKLHSITSSYGIRQPQALRSYEKPPSYKATKPLTLAQKATQLLIQYPYLNEELNQLPEATAETAQLLSVLDFIYQNPETNTAAILNHFTDIKLIALSLHSIDEFTGLIDKISRNQRKAYLNLRIKTGDYSEQELKEFQELVLTN
ncbi:DNA primase [Candidatus Albibeggiatoa sp. nov. BB20]|uniref:DNA primase n=1 Tax=Candidatus Albibeggiatoa sp. nov. BB20 TaxID=3162723 RepID=UPI0033656E42